MPEDLLPGQLGSTLGGQLQAHEFGSRLVLGSAQVLLQMQVHVFVSRSLLGSGHVLVQHPADEQFCFLVCVSVQE